jgi:hypothetical protein
MGLAKKYLFPQRRKAAKQLKITAEHYFTANTPPSCFAGKIYYLSFSITL